MQCPQDTESRRPSSSTYRGCVVQATVGSAQRYGHAEMVKAAPQVSTRSNDLKSCETLMNHDWLYSQKSVILFAVEPHNTARPGADIVRYILALFQQKNRKNLCATLPY